MRNIIFNDFTLKYGKTGKRNRNSRVLSSPGRIYMAKERQTDGEASPQINK